MPDIKAPKWHAVNGSFESYLLTPPSPQKGFDAAAQIEATTTSIKLGCDRINSLTPSPSKIRHPKEKLKPSKKNQKKMSIAAATTVAAAKDSKRKLAAASCEPKASKKQKIVDGVQSAQEPPLTSEPLAVKDLTGSVMKAKSTRLKAISDPPRTPSRKHKKHQTKTIKDRRSQGVRHAKLYPTVEAATSEKVIDKYECSKSDGKTGEDCPSASETDANTTPTTTPRRHSHKTLPDEMKQTERKEGSLGASSPSSQQPDTALEIIWKKEPFDNHLATPSDWMPTPPSPSIYDSKRRKEKLDREGIVELPSDDKLEQEYLEIKEARRKIKREEREKRDIWVERRKMKKGKDTVKRCPAETQESNMRRNKKKKLNGFVAVKQEDVQEPFLMRDQRINAVETARGGVVPAIPSEEPVRESALAATDPLEPQSLSDIESPIVCEDTSQQHATSCSVLERKESKGGSKSVLSPHHETVMTTMSDSQPKEHVGLRRQDYQSTATPPKYNSRWRSSSHCRTQKVQSKTVGPNLESRVLVVPRKYCICSGLPSYFTDEWRRIPSLDTWIGEEHTFYLHVSQIASCSGHSRAAQEACRTIVLKKQNEIEAAVDYAQSLLADPSIEEMSPMRAQSSIPPPEFYGQSARMKHSNVMPSPPKSSPTVSNRPIAGVATSIKSMKRVLNSRLILTPPNSSPLKRKISNWETLNKKTSKSSPTCTVIDLQEASLSEPVSVSKNFSPEAAESSFHAIRQRRHQSMPASVHRQHAEQAKQTVVNAVVANSIMLKERTIQQMSNNTSFSKEEIARIVDEAIEKNLERNFARIRASMGPQQTNTISTFPSREVNPKPPAAIRKGKTVAERKARLPPITHEVPNEDRAPDRELIRIGKILNHYERHCAAHYAFHWSGLLKAEYKYLFALQGQNGFPFWTPNEVSRIMR